MKPKNPKPRRIRNRDDLSFTMRDEKECLLYWCVPNRENSWHENYGIGQAWFEEVVQLAHANPKEAYAAMLYGANVACTRYWDLGHADGFFDMMARWALVAIMANEVLPTLPFKINEMGIPPREGMDFLRTREGEKGYFAYQHLCQTRSAIQSHCHSICTFSGNRWRSDARSAVLKTADCSAPSMPGRAGATRGAGIISVRTFANTRKAQHVHARTIRCFLC